MEGTDTTQETRGAGPWVCARCRSPDIQEVAWVEVNTRRVVEGEAPIESTWCPACEQNNTGMVHAHVDR